MRLEGLDIHKRLLLPDCHLQNLQILYLIPQIPHVYNLIAQPFPPSPPDSSSSNSPPPEPQSRAAPPITKPQHNIISHVPRNNNQPHKTGVQRSWETMWVPGIDGLGAHIICREWLSPSLTAIGRQKLL